MFRFGSSCFVLIALAFLAASPRIAHGAQSYDNCTGVITSLPVVINTSGTWCLKQDLSTAIASGSAITVGTNNVTVDCNDFKLDGLAAGAATQTIGIRAANRLNVTVRDCNVRGFYVGLSFTGAAGGGHLVEDNNFNANTFMGLSLDGDGSMARRNRVLDTGGSTTAVHVYGINSNYSVDIVDNTVSGVTARYGSNGWAMGITTQTNSSGKISGNGVRLLARDGTGKVVGIRNLTSGRIIVRNNDLVADGDTTGSIGVTCSATTGAVKDNVINSFATAISGCTDSGGNSLIP